MSEEKIKKAILVSVAERSAEVYVCERSLDELERLLDTAGGKCYAKVIQVKDKLDPRTVIGKGKVEEIKNLAISGDVQLVIFDFELSPMQIRNLEDDIGDVTVIDRSMLILDIFALHATTGEGKLQVELAQLKYTSPRLIGKGKELSRQGGGIGTRGPGESKLESDRRHLHTKIAALEEKIRELEDNRRTMRAQRDKSGLVKIGVVGYTNAGKSTLLNYLTNAGVLAENKLFATLDPTTRKLTLPGGETVLLTDTVGFINKLPHHLIKAFKSTLDEVKYSDILLIVSDVSDPEILEHISVTEKLIEELGASDKPRVYAYNKADINAELYESFALPKENSVMISAKEGMGIDNLLSILEKIVNESKHEVVLNIPYSRQDIVSSLYNTATVKEVSYEAEFIKVVAIIGNEKLGALKIYIK